MDKEKFIESLKFAGFEPYTGSPENFDWKIYEDVKSYIAIRFLNEDYEKLIMWACDWIGC